MIILKHGIAIITTLLMCCPITFVTAQCAKHPSISLNTRNTTGVYTAFKSVTLKAGFSAKATRLNSFNAFTKENWCSGYTPYVNEDNLDAEIISLLTASCSVSIPIISERQISATYVEEQCFNFDEAGNQNDNGSCLNTPSSTIENNTFVELEKTEELTLENISNKIYVVPNPTRGNVTISWDEDIKHFIDQIIIVPMTGATINIPVQYSPNTNIATSDLSRYSSGYYVVRFILNTGDLITKTIIKI